MKPQNKTRKKTKCDFQHFKIAVRKNISSFCFFFPDISIILQLDYEKAYSYKKQGFWETMSIETAAEQGL